jgi:hypothetical protein
MKVFELDSDAELTKDMIREFGAPLTIRERIKLKSYGLGNLRLRPGNELLTALYEHENNTIKTHFDWTTKGAVIRMRTMRKPYAIGFKDEQLESVVLTKIEDYIRAIPLSPFWIMLKLGVRPPIASLFKLRTERFVRGPALIDITLTDNNNLSFEVAGDLWVDCLSTFGVNKIKGRVRIDDQRNISSKKVQRYS